MKKISDPAFPNLHLAFDMDKVSVLLSKGFPEIGRGLALEECLFFDIRYRPAEECVLLYRLKLREKSGTKKVKQFVSVEFLKEGNSTALPEELMARYRSSPELPLQTPGKFLSDEQIILTAFPIDKAMPHLVDALDPSTLKRWLNRIWKDDHLQVKKVNPELLGYTPRSRAAFSYEVSCVDKLTGNPCDQSLIGKMHRFKRTGDLYSSAWALWEAAEQRVGLAKPMGFIESLDLTFQQKVPGGRLGALAGEPSFPDLLSQVGRDLALLHSLTIPLITRRDPKDEAKTVKRWGTVLQSIRPDFAVRVERLQTQIMKDLENRTRMIGLVHADFHHTNILVDGDRITYIDLDELTYGDSMLDVGRLLASLSIPALRTFGDHTALDGSKENFLAEYLRHSGEKEQHARLFESACLFTSAASAFRLQRPNWEAEVPLLVDAAEQAFNRSKKGAPVFVSKNHIVKDFQDRIAWAAKGDYVRARLAPLFRDQYGAEITSFLPKIKTQKEKNCRIRYTLKCWKNNEKRKMYLEGFLHSNRSGLATKNDLISVRDALASKPDAPLLSHPVTLLPTLDLLVLESPDGKKLSTIVDFDEILAIVNHTAKALASLNSLDLGLKNNRTFETDLAALKQNIEELGSNHHIYPRAVSLEKKLSERIDASKTRMVPSINQLALNDVVWDGVHVGFLNTSSLSDSTPEVGIANFIAQLYKFCFQAGQDQNAELLYQSFMNNYNGSAFTQIDLDMNAFMGMAHLRLGCLEQSDPNLANRLIEKAENFLETV